MSEHDHDLDHDLPPLPQHVLDEAEAGCEESRLVINRRGLLGLTAGLFTWAYMPKYASAEGVAAPGEEPRLLIVLLRGGMDGLHVAPPLTDPDYKTWRSEIALTNLLPLTPEFGMHPSMPNLQKMFFAKEASLVQAIAPPLRRRSHFEGLYNIESGLPGVGPRNSTSGWVNRLLLQLPAGRRVDQLALQLGPTPLIMAGAAPVLSWTNVPSFTKSLDVPLQALYDKDYRELLGKPLERGLRINGFALSGSTDQTRAADKGVSAIRINFRAAARMMRDEKGPRIAVLDINGWDTHVGLESILRPKLADLDNSLQDFKDLIGPAAWSKTAVICVTEMGRTAAVNGYAGTDHGDASVAFLLGGAINGGKVWGDWPGLAKNQLTDERSLRATTDMRIVFKGLLADHLGVPAAILDDAVFPDSKDAPAMKDLLKNPVPPDPEITGVKDVPTTGAGSSLADFRQLYGVGLGGARMLPPEYSARQFQAG